MQERQTITLQPLGWQNPPSPEKMLLIIRVSFWLLGTLLASLQAWSHRYWVSADGISYLDMSEAVSSGLGWHRLINGTWSPLYPFLLGISEVLRPDRYREIVTGHVLNIVLFLGALAAFEYLMCGVWPPPSASDDVAENVLLPRWTSFVAGYSVFLWASLGEITLAYLRADILMTVFLFIAMGLVVRIQNNGATWSRYSVLGVVLGIGYLSKQPMLPIGLLIITSSVLASNDRFRVLPKGLLAALLLLTIGGAYFIPLSKKVGHLTFGEASTYNYLVYIDQHAETEYLMDPGLGTGKFLNVPVKIFDAPPTYSFFSSKAVTHHMRYDPSYWTQGAKARFSAGGELRAVFLNVMPYIAILERTGGLTVGFIVLCFLAGDSERVLFGIRQQWPLWFIGLCGLAMYALMHVEDRYIGAFFVLAWLGLMSRIRVPRVLLNRGAQGASLGIAISILLPLIGTVGYDVIHQRNVSDQGAEAAKQLASLGIRPADRVARISPWYTDYAWAHMSRVSITAEVDPRHAEEFWERGPDIQAQVLKAMSDVGARVVVAHIAGGAAPPNWQRLGNTQQWMHWLQ
jgi:hypothetical protein